MSGERISEAFAVVVELATALGVKRINELPGTWDVQIDEHWKVRVNAQKTELDCIPPYHASVEWNGFPAGLFSPAGGIIAAGELANEASFIAAVRARIAKELPAEL